MRVLALCFFPFARRATLLIPLGATDPEFVPERTAHVVELLPHGVVGPNARGIDSEHRGRQ
ncbi:MAG: hypothetical protein KY447_11685 [Actinobacteria bacterium]|nr:hypothetical protein [Actinomycetota bacterium]